MPLQQTSGNVTQDAYGGGKAVVPTYVENVFSTYLYTGTGAAQTIVNNIDISDFDALLWIKSRSASTNNLVTSKGYSPFLLSTNNTSAIVYDANSVTSLNTNGFSLGSGSGSGKEVNVSGVTYTSWTFRKAPKFFTAISYAGTGSAQNIAHDLGSVPGCIIIKNYTSGSANWAVYHSGANGGTNPQNYYTLLNSTAAQSSSSTYWNNTAPTSTQFTVGSSADTNTSGGSYIAYLFATSGTGGFGLTGTQDIISCGSYTGTGSAGNNVSLGWEPQWVLIKKTNNTNDWYIQDVMRGMSNTDMVYLNPDTSSAESDLGASMVVPTATGFTLSQGYNGWNASGDNYIYIAIRRGPMATPTTGTSVFTPIVAVPNTSQVNLSYAPDVTITTELSRSIQGQTFLFDRLRGIVPPLETNQTFPESTYSISPTGINMTNNGFIDTYMSTSQGITDSVIYWNFGRAPSFMDEVCYTGTSSNTTQSHNLGVVPEMMIVKARNFSGQPWAVYHKAVGSTQYLALNTSGTPITNDTWNGAPTSTVINLGTANPTNATTHTYVAYLFATCSGVSYVGSYTGTGGTQSIACGFGAGGARFILAKRTDSTGDWYCWDSANGLTSSSSPYILWDSNAAQTTGNNGVYASSGGFTLTSNASSTVNVNSGTFIFLAIA